MTIGATLPSGDPRHGTLNGYQYHGCRCDRCRSANTDAQSRRRRYSGGHPGLKGGSPPVEPDDSPWVCECDRPAPDAVGECAGCRRLVLSHSYAEGRPPVTCRPVPVADVAAGSAVWDARDRRFVFVDANPPTDAALQTVTFDDGVVDDYDRRTKFLVADNAWDASRHNHGELVA